MLCPCTGAIYMYMTTIFKDLFFSKTTLPIKANSQAKPPREGGNKVYINGQGHIALDGWPPHRYMVKTFKNRLLQNQKSYDLET